MYCFINEEINGGEMIYCMLIINKCISMGIIINKCICMHGHTACGQQYVYETK